MTGVQDITKIIDENDNTNTTSSSSLSSPSVTLSPLQRQLFLHERHTLSSLSPPLLHQATLVAAFNQMMREVRAETDEERVKIIARS